MSKNLKKAILISVNIIFLFTLVIMQYTPLLSLKIGNASPILSLAAVISLSMFCSPLESSLIGMAVGIFTDTSSSTPLGFNSIVFFIAAFLTSFLIHYLFNNNFRSGIALGLMMSTLYFALRWLAFFCFAHDITDSFYYLFRHALPSLIYTAIFTLIFYFFEKFLFKKLS